MTHAKKISACDDCQPAGFFEACGTMEEILVGDLDAEDWICQDHREEMNEATREWAEQRERSN